ncbi:outer membrane protein OmpA-like peptidoglycan-associated protein [Haloactinospora alba]|uniref:Outer membrane protein OmpA-like peptidoglycan-associated protein n=1 Tax=Haloactinospora alba TaxID=405555 RepID=A0A543NGI7_9ACTN|nr:OmpA family protein [Haloactinospora alba]TQN30923.1 outer membrane protein OmpA-like peptidoglycan-associated protein [Haloactinospora alba]
MRKLAETSGFPLLALTVALVTGTTGCATFSSDSGSDQEEGKDADGSSDGREKPASSITNQPLTEHPQSSETELSLYRLGEEHLVAAFEVTNTSSENISVWGDLDWGFKGGGDFVTEAFSGIGWIDEANQALQMPYRRPEGRCLCTETEDSLAQRIGAGDSKTFAAVMSAPPSDVSEVSVITSSTSPFVSVPISEEKPDLDSLGLPHPDDASQAKPQAWEMVASSASEDGSDEVVEDSETTNINLSTDVLFDVNKSEITSEASEVLERSAKQVEESSVSQVRIEGHTDDTGSDEINEPLSEERAESVRDELEELVDRDVSYETEGFGSREPLYDGTSEKARERNRRVSVIIPKDEEGTAPKERPDDSSTAGGSSDNSSGGEQPAGRPATEASSHLAQEVIDDQVDYDLQMTGLHRVNSNGALLTYTITNNSEKDKSPWGALRSEKFSETWGMPVDGVKIVDPVTDRRYRTAYVLGPDKGTRNCPCSQTNSISSIDVGASKEFYNFIFLPEDVSVVNIKAGLFPVMENLTVE